MEQLNNIQINTNLFESIRLNEMDKVQLMNRTDTKYWFHIEKLAHLIDQIKNDYFVLTIGSETVLPYSTTYFDTPENKMFATHHNGKLNRYKVRRRTYVNSQISFWEVKFKSNKGRTIKARVKSPFGSDSMSAKESRFITENSPFNSAQLIPVLENGFNRITLVNKNFEERCTIDLNLSFSDGAKSVQLNELVIVEIKANGHSNASSLAKALFSFRIKTSGFSKYCVGRTLIHPDLKRNSFKKKIRSIQKIIHTEQNLYALNSKL